MEIRDAGGDTEEIMNARFHKIEYGRELRDSNGQMLLSHFLLEIKTNRE